MLWTYSFQVGISEGKLEDVRARCGLLHHWRRRYGFQDVCHSQKM